MMIVKQLKIDSLHVDPANVRTHDGRNLKAIEASLRQFGQQKPIVVNDAGVVVAGNGTLEAARTLGWSDIDAVQTALNGPEAVAYAIADNRTAELADWDEPNLAAVLESIRTSETLELGIVGFTDDELDEMLGRLPASADGQEFDESCADDVEMTECPNCGHKFPK